MPPPTHARPHNEIDSTHDETGRLSSQLRSGRRQPAAYYGHLIRLGVDVGGDNAEHLWLL
jgi:hypothetical protein